MVQALVCLRAFNTRSMIWKGDTRITLFQIISGNRYSDTDTRSGKAFRLLRNTSQYDKISRTKSATTLECLLLGTRASKRAVQFSKVKLVFHNMIRKEHSEVWDSSGWPNENRAKFEHVAHSSPTKERIRGVAMGYFYLEGTTEVS